MSEKVLKIDINELRAALLEARAFMFLLYRYFRDPSFFKTACFWEIFNPIEIEDLLLRFDTVLNQLGVTFEEEN